MTDRELCACGRGPVMPSTQKRGGPGHCSKCQAPRRDRYRATDVGAAVTRKIRNDYRRKLRSETIAAYGGSCQCCGESRELFLTIDHVFNDGGGRRRPLAGLALWTWLRAHGYPKDRFQLLCWNCNLGKHNNGGVCPHQEERMAVEAQRIREKGQWP